MENNTKVSEARVWYTALADAPVITAAVWSLCTAYRNADNGSTGGMVFAWDTLQHELEPVIYGHPVPHVHTVERT